MSRQQILTIEDDPAIRRGIVDALRFAGYKVLGRLRRVAAPIVRSELSIAKDRFGKSSVLLRQQEHRERHRRLRAYPKTGTGSEHET